MSLEEISAEAYLFIEVGKKVYKYRIRQPVISIGSDEDNTIRIREPSVEPHHLLLSYVVGRFHLRRLGDAPARINDERVEAYTEELRYGDEIGIGDVILRLVEGGEISAVAVALSIWQRAGEGESAWHFFLTRRTEFRVGEQPADLVLPGGGTVAFENFGPGAQYIVPSEHTRLRVNEEIVEKRGKLKDGDVVSIPGYVMRVRLLRGEVLEDPEALLGLDALRRYAVEARKHGK